MEIEDAYHRHEIENKVKGIEQEPPYLRRTDNPLPITSQKHRKDRTKRVDNQEGLTEHVDRALLPVHLLGEMDFHGLP